MAKSESVKVSCKSNERKSLIQGGDTGARSFEFDTIFANSSAVDASKKRSEQGGSAISSDETSCGGLLKYMVHWLSIRSTDAISLLS